MVSGWRLEVSGGWLAGGSFLLVAPQFMEDGAIVAEVPETAFGDDPALVQHVYIVEAGQQVEAMDGGNDGFIGEGFEEAFIDHGFGARVYAAGRFVEEDDAAVACGEDAPGEGEALFLSAREIDAFLADIGFQSLGKLADDLGEMGAFTDLEDLLFAKGEAEGDVVGQGIFKDFGFLREEGNGFVQAVEPGLGVGVG